MAKLNKKKTRPAYNRPGVCDQCGCAVVRSHEEMHDAAVKLGADLKIDGHFYEQGVLMQVRCAMHSNYKDGDIPPAEDARGGSGAHKRGKFVRYCVEGAQMADCCEKEQAVKRAFSGEFNGAQRVSGAFHDIIVD